MEEREMIEMDEMENIEETEEVSGMSTGKAILVGAVLGIAGTAIARFARKKWSERKAKKENAVVIEGNFTEHVEESNSDDDAE